MDYFEQGNPAYQEEEKNSPKCVECSVVLDWRYDFDNICKECHELEDELEEAQSLSVWDKMKQSAKDEFIKNTKNKYPSIYQNIINELKEEQQIENLKVSTVYAFCLFSSDDEFKKLKFRDMYFLLK